MRKLIALSLPLLLSSLIAYVECSERKSEHESDGHNTNKDDLLFAYFEAPLPEDEAFGKIGPTVWRDLFRIHPNFCGGNGQHNGFGQSPVVIDEADLLNCDRNMNEYSFSDGNCKFEDLKFEVNKDGLSVGPKGADAHSTCSLGMVKIPGNDKSLEAIEIRMKLGAEHIHAGHESSAEIQVYFREEGEIRAAISILVEVSNSNDDEPPKTDEQPFYESLLKGWEASSHWTDKFCALNPKGTELFTTNTALKAQQKKITCPKVGSGSTEQVPSVESPERPVPNVFKNGTLIESEQYGIYSYQGSMTTPPCTENIYWSIIDAHMLISVDQFLRTQELILCFVDRSTCEHASAASEFGRTTRPPQLLNGRQIVHYCHDNMENTTLIQAPEIPEYEMEEETHPYLAILFPWLVSLFSVFVFYLLTRYVPGLPYTAVLFALGALMGVGISFREDSHDQFTSSIRMWDNINSELLLLVFLPGLLFKDAYSLNFHLFRKGFGQILIMGFPMVLAGTSLMALVGKYVLPYDWGFNLSMTFGAIVSATDPVAVSALLNELGAPPRLKTHIAGESLLNDGSAYVFFVIFSQLFLFDINIHGGKDIGVAEGFKLFFEISLGATAIGIASGFLLMFILYILKRRFNHEESIVQVSITITVAYLSYYVAEVILHFSGIIAVVICGITTKAFASTLITDQEMMSKFWEIIEHLLNTVLFALGGVVWGTVISNQDDDNFTFGWNDFGYWILVYILMTAVRFFLFGFFYPLISRIGLKSSKEEVLFQAFGGLRGAVGIALAIALDFEVRHATVNTDPNRDFTRQLFGVTGWIALVTLFVNGTLAGPLLRYLKLGRASKVREKVTDQYTDHFKRKVLELLVKLLGESRFADVDFKFVSHHVSCLSKLTIEELKMAARNVKERTSLARYKQPDFSLFDSHFDEEELEIVKTMTKVKLADMFRSAVRKINMLKRSEIETIRMGRASMIWNENDGSKKVLVELRLLFVELLRHAYQDDMQKGEVDVREELVVYGLNESVAITEDEVTNGHPINDWEACQRLLNSFIFKEIRKYNEERFLAYDIHIASALIQAHEEAQMTFQHNFCKAGLMTSLEITVLDESDAQIELAREKLNTIDRAQKKRIMTYLMASILLNSEARDVNDHVKRGLLKAAEGEHHLERIEKELESVRKAKYGEVNVDFVVKDLPPSNHKAV